EILERLAHGDEFFAHDQLVLRFFKGLVRGDELAVHQIEQVRVHGDHAEVTAGLDVGGDPEGFVFADHGGDRGRVDHDLVAGDAAAADLLAEHLGNDGDDRGRE